MNDTCNASPAERRAQIDAAALAIAEAQAADYARPHLAHMDALPYPQYVDWLAGRLFHSELAAAAWELRWSAVPVGEQR